ncbi:DUF1772 domain-containing protein [Chitinophaga sedimenti]|uniref:anthrone oxygenase family protein n=1 Tax=Chitinophaga sedimenti TaxID=2033606 RepID=UPI0020051F5E|nr:anthrone oxygenase family protein [Chitinophaga sedimenti]MCK7555828.1 DUF1772 domain-containing protein [Chitinophaga sedimenti]
MPTFSNIVLFITTILSALMAGLFYAWSISVMPGLARISDRAFIEAMQGMNRAILNPVFFIAFIGCVFLLPASAWLSFNRPVSLRFMLVLAAAAVYLVGVFGVTAAGNVPLNESLDKFQLAGAASEDLATFRRHFEASWNRFNQVRTVAAFVVLLLMVAACWWREV